MVTVTFFLYTNKTILNFSCTIPLWSRHANCLSTSVMARKEFEITVEKWWGKESVVLRPDCFLSRLKTLLCDELVSVGVLSSSDMDVRNSTPHIKVTESSGKGGDEKKKFRGFEGVKYSMTPRDLSIGRNVLEFDVGGSVDGGNGQKMHFTIVYKRDLGIHRAKINAAIEKIWPSALGLTLTPTATPVVEEKKSVSGKLCAVCLDAEYNCVLNCGHMCMCMDCAKQVDRCPKCRASISSRLKVFAG